MLWWWDTYIEPNDLYYHFKGISSFFADEKLHENRLKPARLTSKNENIQAFGLLGEERALIWIRSMKYNNRNFEHQAFKVGPEKVVFPKVKGAVEIPGLRPGTYLLQRWDTITGKMLSQTVIRHKGGVYTLKLPSFDKDLAFKIVAQG